MSKEKNKQISDSLNETRLKRLNQDCKTFSIKIQENKLNLKQKEYLKMIFLESKWLSNHILSLDNIFNFDTKIKQINVLNKDKQIEQRIIKYLPSQVKQEIHSRICDDIKGLLVKKKNGYKTGKLKFKKEVVSIPFKQYGNSHEIINNKLKLSKCKYLFKVSGLKQLIGYELTSAVLTKNSTGIYLKITCYKNKEVKILPREVVGIDFGIKTSLTLSNGIKMDTKMELPKSVIKNHKKLSKKVKSSNNYIKQKEKLNKSYKKYVNKKTDNKNKIINYLKNNYCHIGIQDENIKGWHSGLFGKQIQQSILGGIIVELKKLPHTLVIDRFYPSTKKCLGCGKLNKIKLSERIYSCSCGYEEDRDTHSSMSILIESFNKTTVPMECRDFKPVELNTSALDKLKNNSSASIDYEAGRYNSLELC